MPRCHYATPCFRLPAGPKGHLLRLKSQLLRFIEQQEEGGRDGMVTIWLFSLFAGQLVHLVLRPRLAKEGLGDGGGWHDVRPAPAVRGEDGRAVRAHRPRLLLLLLLLLVQLGAHAGSIRKLLVYPT